MHTRVVVRSRKAYGRLEETITLSPDKTWGLASLPFSSVSDPEQLAILADVLNDVCAAAGIEPDSPDRQDLAELIVSLFWEGNRTAEELRQAIAKRIDREERRCG